ncbi:lysostaphin resistance A-like protein [Pantanalinema sp. GBBB05]|uniref:CPBP family intramembrane glutamic endopeptidase n=1 Tax=Pantanalinema sp. GBBB05 TaxID=2604139 RepID=UPI001D8BCE24|nr:CPBP family intramembrane metalloprotease [Pantanalinema sp. GBBB05]
MLALAESQVLNHLITALPAFMQIALFFAVWLLLWLPIAIPIAVVVQWRPSQPITLQQKLPLLASLYAIAPLVLWLAAHLEMLPFSVYGITWNLAFCRSVGIGLVISTGGLVGLFGVQQLVGWLTWNRDRWSDLRAALLPTLGLGLWVSCTEELIFRGFLFNHLQQDYAPWLAAVLSSLIFALLHLVWEGRAIAPQLPGLWLMGMVLVLSRWLDRGSLGIACGLHAGWIWGIASLDTADIVQYTGRGSAWLTGLAGKPLAGGIGLLLMLLTGGVLLIGY